LTTAGATAEEVAEHGVYAALSAPHFQYRAELGTNVAAEEILAPYELASMISYFITGGPPDDALLADASTGALATPDAIRVHADRLLVTPDARDNLQQLVLSYFGVPGVYNVVIQSPDFTGGVASSMVREAQLFFNNTIWAGGPATDLITSQTSWINSELAPIYGVTWPPASQQDADGFAQVTLPADRAGMLTNAGYLAATARPDIASVVGRGIRVVDQFLCIERAPFPENLAAAIEEFNLAQAGETERTKANVRMETAPCSGCHLQTDPYGLSLENYDVVGKYRTMDPEGRPIDATLTLPEAAGGAMIASSFEMGQSITTSGVFVACMAGNLMEDAIGEGTVLATDCSATSVLNSLQTAGSQTFSDIVREVTASRTMAFRRGGI
jgi:hypothetical protein